jgi:hypothetical protein
MNTSSVVLVLATLSCGFSPIAIAQDTEVIQAPMFRIGDKWTYRTPRGRYNSEVVEVGNVVVFQSKTKRSVVTPEGNFTVFRGVGDNSIVMYFPCIPRLNFPLWEGKQWSIPYFYVSSRLKGGFWMHGKAYAWENIMVPAGTFRALRIENKSTGTVNERCWYVPKVKRFVRCESLSGEGEHLYELVNFEVAQ